jgi:predicted negative regulator of RcsB-dependent stress response
LFKNNSEDEVDFCESYKSQILNNDTKEESSLFKSIVKVLIILLLMALIIAISIYGYEYYQKMQDGQTQTNSIEKIEDISTPPTSIQISDEELVVQDEEVEPELNVSEPTRKEKVEQSSTATLPIIEKIKDEDIEKIANEVKLEISKSEMKKKNSTKKETIKKSESKVEQKVKEEKVEESLEIPTSNPESKYLEDLAKLSKEIDKERKK